MEQWSQLGSPAGPTSLLWSRSAADLHPGRSLGCPGVFTSGFVQRLSPATLCTLRSSLSSAWPWCLTPTIPQKQNHRKILSGRSFLFFRVGDVVPMDGRADKSWCHWYNPQRIRCLLGRQEAVLSSYAIPGLICVWMFICSPLAGSVLLAAY